MSKNIDFVEGTETHGEVVVNSSKDFEQRPDIGTVQNLEESYENKEDTIYD